MMKNGSLDKEGWAAASGCRGGSKAVRISKLQRGATTPAGPSAQLSPPQLRRGACFQECRTCLQREGNPNMRKFASYPLLIFPLCASQGAEKLRPLLDKGGPQGGSASPLRPGAVKKLKLIEKRGSPLPNEGEG